MIRRLLPMALLFVLASCSPTAQTAAVERRAPMADGLPPMKTFAAPRVKQSKRSNAQLVQDFLELSFQMESGRPLPYLTRFEGPVTVKVRGNAPAHLDKDLARLISRLRNEAGVNISRVGGDTDANIVIEVLSKRELQRLVPQAACFVVPRVASWGEFRKARRSRTVDWTTLETRQRVAVFLPGDVSPQEVRDCLHEEVAQALGPLNDLYRLPESVFNDDNFHTVLTGFDMLMLRAYYAPELRNGMTKAQVANRLPGIFARINPAGQRGGAALARQTPRAWKDAIETALGPRASASQRLEAAERAVRIGKSQGWSDNRMAFSLYAQGRLSLVREPELSLTSFLEAARLYRQSSETQVQAAHVAMQLAAFSLSAGQADGTLALVNNSLPAVENAENAALLATLLMIKAEALDLMGRVSEAQAVRMDSLGWARYGFGASPVVRARLSEIAALKPRRTVQ